jgi:hypothetical protein
LEFVKLYILETEGSNEKNHWKVIDKKIQIKHSF